MKTAILSLSLLFLLISTGKAIECKDPAGGGLDFFSILRFPRKVQEEPDQTNKFAYYDSSMSSSGFELRTNYVDVQDEPLARLLVDLNSNFDNLNLIAWNDGFFSSTKGTAHSKGIIAYEASSDRGIYLVHSVPQFPNVSNNQFDSLIPDGNRIYGQSFLCLSLNGSVLENIAGGLLLENIEIYFQNFNAVGLPNLASLAQGNNVKSPGSLAFSFKTANKGVQFNAFIKNAYQTDIFLYDDVVIPGLNLDLFVESWGRPYMASNCSLDQGRSVKNIQSIKIPTDNIANWTNTQDHSKWAISATDSLPYVCIGDMNRQASQANRGGGAFCLNNIGMWTAFKSVIWTVEECSSNKFLDY